MEKYEVSYKAPSNIALVKYWGKKGLQKPLNPNLSFSLSVCHTVTRVVFRKGVGKTSCFVKGEKNDNFLPKINAFIDRISPEFNEIKDYKIDIYTHNTFPHGSGIASSASGFAALALCMADIYAQINNEPLDELFKQRASTWARLGSGSAARSIYGGFVSWGSLKGTTSKEYTEDFATPIPNTNIHPTFHDLRDTILLVENKEKAVSSSSGHALVENHFYKQGRLHQANNNYIECQERLMNGDKEGLKKIIESEALSLHALMQSSIPYFVLMKPNTLNIIQKLWAWREQNKLWAVFTLDAGANVHLIHLNKDKDLVEKFVQKELSTFCENGAYICDHIGEGPKKLN